tara:strand:- start:431 stop:667 length:237 start_codon:yes stop_codon:yes gene_type:complete
MVKKNWMQKVDREMDKDKTVGAFTRQAKRAGMSVQAYARKVIKELKGKKGLSVAQKTLLKRAVLARTYKRIAKKRKKK